MPAGSGSWAMTCACCEGVDPHGAARHPPVAARLAEHRPGGPPAWLTGRRPPEENWDAFEGVGGEPLLRLIENRQPWSQVRFWLYDLAREISAAEKDGTLPTVLTLDRIWITGDGRAKLLDFPAPGLAQPLLDQAALHGRGVPPLLETGRTQRFLGEVAVAALEGRADAAAKTAVDAAVPLPLHARNFLKNLPQLSPVDAVAAAIQPLRGAQPRSRDCGARRSSQAVPSLSRAGECFMVVGLAMLQQSHPGIMELSCCCRPSKDIRPMRREGCTRPG